MTRLFLSPSIINEDRSRMFSRLSRPKAMIFLVTLVWGFFEDLKVHFQIEILNALMGGGEKTDVSEVKLKKKED